MPTQMNHDHHKYDPVNVVVSVSGCSKVAVDLYFKLHFEFGRILS